MARTANEQLHANRREEILRAAARVFKRKGFHFARTEDIVAESGLSAGTIFRYFASKQEMILGIAVKELEHYRETLTSLGNHDGLRWLSRIKGGELAALLTSSEYSLGLESLVELYRQAEWREKVMALDVELREAMVQALATGQREGWARPDFDPVGMTNVIQAIFTGLGVDQELGVSTDHEATARALSMFFKGILADEE